MAAHVTRIAETFEPRIGAKVRVDNGATGTVTDKRVTDPRYPAEYRVDLDPEWARKLGSGFLRREAKYLTPIGGAPGATATTVVSKDPTPDIVAKLTKFLNDKNQDRSAKPGIKVTKNGGKTHISGEYRVFGYRDPERERDLAQTIRRQHTTWLQTAVPLPLGASVVLQPQDKGYITVDINY